MKLPLPILVILLLLGCQSAENVAFDVPAGSAATTLKIYATQAGVEIMFNPETLENVETRPIKGNYSIEKALSLMTSETELFFHKDQKTGAIAISKKTTPPTLTENSTTPS